MSKYLEAKYGGVVDSFAISNPAISDEKKVNRIKTESLSQYKIKFICHGLFFQL